MGRWQPDAQRRLAQAATELFAERGYEDVTVAEIAGRAGLTSRTFFRHFSDKREVLFAGAEGLLDVLTDAVAAAPASTPVLDVVSAALEAVSETIGGDRAYSRQRAATIATHIELQERELVKLASWARTVAAALQHRGTDPADATLAAETGMAVFRVAFDAWLVGPARRSLVASVRASFVRLRELSVD